MNRKHHHIYDYIERLSALFRVDARKVLTEYGLQPIQLEALHYLSQCNRFSDTPLAVSEYLGQTKGTVSQTLKVLEKNGLLIKESDPADKRVTHLNLTAEGHKLLKHCLPTPMIQQALTAMPEEDQIKVETALNTLLSTLLKQNEMKPFGICKTCRYNRPLLSEAERKNENFYCELVNTALSENDVNLICREHTPSPPHSKS